MFCNDIWLLVISCYQSLVACAKQCTYPPNNLHITLLFVCLFVYIVCMVEVYCGLHIEYISFCGFVLYYDISNKFANPNCWHIVVWIYSIIFFVFWDVLQGPSSFLQYLHSYHNIWMHFSSYIPAHVMHSNIDPPPLDTCKKHVPMQIVPLCCMLCGKYSMYTGG